MIVFTLILVTLSLTAWACWLLWRSIRHGLPYNRISALAGLAIAFFAMRYGTWVYLSVYLKWLVPVAFILSGLLALSRKSSTPRRPSRGRTVGNTIVLVIFGMLVLLYYTGTAGNYRSVDLHFPLKSGHYIILQGGKGLPANLFHYNARKAVFAIDLAKLNAAGNRANTVFSKRLEDYEIFGDTVFSPAAGIVERAVSDNPDNIPPDRTRGPHNLNGVVLRAKECTIFMGHMQQHKVFVEEGDSVAAGQPLGLVGNSGASIEPHLHIQAHAPGDGPWYQQPQLFITFDGQGYLLFEEIDATRSPDAAQNDH